MGLIFYVGSYTAFYAGCQKVGMEFAPSRLKFFLSHTSSPPNSFLMLFYNPLLVLHGTRAEEYLWLCFSLHQAMLAGGSL